MSDAMFSIDLDVSRALAAQDRIIKKFQEFANEIPEIAKSMEPLKQGFGDVDKAVGNITQKGLSNLERQLRKVLAVQTEMANAHNFGNIDLKGFATLEKYLNRIRQGIADIKRDTAKDITPKFNIQTVAQFEEAIAKVRERLRSLEYVKTTMNAIDYVNFKASYEQALAGYQTALRNTIDKAAAYNAKNKATFNYPNMGSYQMMGFAGPVSGGLTSSLNSSLSAMSGFNNEAGKVGSKLQQMAINAQDAEKKLNGLGLVIKRVFEYGLVYRFQNALLSLPGAFYEMNSAMEKFGASYRGIFGEDAVSKMQYVKDAANKYGMDIIALAESYKKFSVTLDELGVSGNTTDRIFESFTEGLKKAGATSTDSENAFRALIQMYSKGIVSAEEFTRQLSQYIPAANAMAARSLGVTTAEFKKMMAAGQVIPEQFIPEFTKQMKVFGLGWEESAKTMESSVSRMKNTLMELADSKAFQEAFSDTTNFISAALKDLGNVFAGGRLAARGDISFTTWLLGSPEDLDKAIKEYDKKMSTLDSRIAALREKREKTASTTYLMGSADSTITYDPQVEKDLSAAESEKWTQQLKSALKSVTDDYLALQRKFKEGDLTAEADLNFNKEKMMWLLDTLNKVAGFDGKSWLATINIDTSSVTAALNAVDRLFSATREGRIESANASYETANKRQQTLQQEFDKIAGDPASDAVSRARLSSLQEGIRKAGIEAQEAKENVVSLIKTASSREVKELGDGIFTGNSAGKDKASQILQAQKDYVNKYNELMAQYKNSQGTVAAMSPSKFAEVEKKGLEELAGKINQINKQGAGGENAAKRAAIATDKYTESIENLLKKEFALAQDNPLDAAFASIDEKVNSLTSRMEELALKSGSALKDIPAQIAQFKELARGEAVDKQLENLFPWMKHEKEIVVLWDMLVEKWKYASAEAKKHGMAEEELTEKIYNLIAATQQLNKEQKAIADADAATNFKDYAKAMQDLDSARYGEKGSGEKEAIEEFYDTYITLTKGMTESRLEMYRRVAEQAKANGMDEAQAAAYVSSKWQEAEVQRLEAIQKYGSASEAFSARLAQNFETYKDAATKSRESAVQMADSISNMADTVSSGIGQAFGDMIRNIGNGNAKIEDMWKNMLARMLDALASFIEEAVTQWTKNLLAGLFSSSGTSGSNWLGSLTNRASSIGSGATGGSGTSTWKSIGQSIGDSLMGSFSTGSGEASAFLKSLSKANSSGISDVFKKGNITGWNFDDGTQATGSDVSGALGLASGAGSVLSTVGSVLGVVGGIAGLVGIAASLFGEKKEEVKKTASGYNVGVVGGRTGIYNVDFYSDGSVMNAGTTNPDIAKKVSDAFKDAAESLHDFAKELNFAVDVLDDFNFPSMNVTEDQLDGYIRNGQNAMAFLALEKAGLRGAFDFVAEDYEVYVDEFERLSTAISTAGGSLSAYGYDLYTLAGLNAEKVAEIRAKTVEVAAGTADAYAAMATSMGASAEAVEYLRSAAGDGSQALSVTDEQLETILEADWASKVIDKVGGEDAFSSIMENLYRNVFDSVEKYANNLEFYTQKANKYIGKLGDSTVTIDNFWQKFDEALKGYLSPEEFEQWADASSWVNQIDTVNDLVEEWNNSMTKFAQSLDARMQAAEGLDYQSELTQQLAAAEWELYEARKAGYDAALIARLQEVQAAELAATKRKHNEEYVEELRDARERYYSATGDDRGLIDIQMEKNQAELIELSKTYNWSPGSSEEKLFQALEQAQAAEMYNMIKELADKIVSAIESLNLESREATVAGNSDLAGALDLIAGFTKEYQSAIESGVDAATLERLQKVQQAELANYWAEVNGSLIKVNETLEDIRDALLDTFNTFIESQIDTIQSALDNAQTLASAYRSAQTSIQDTLVSWATDSDPSLNAEQTFLNNQSVFGSLFKKAMAGDEEAFGKLAGAAGSYRDSAQAYYGNKTQYEEFYRNLVIQMNQAGDKAGTLADEQDNFSKLYQVQLDLYNLLKTEINSDDPNTAKLQAVVDAIGLTNDAIKTGNTTTSVLQNLTSSGNGGYADIVDAITQKSSLPNTYLDTLVSKQTTLNALMAQFLNVQQKNNLQAQVDAAKTEYLSYYNNAKAAFQGSNVASYIQAIANSGYGWGGAIGNLTTTSYGFTNGQRYIDWAMAGNQTASAMGSWFLKTYGAGTGYVDWDTAMLQWLSSYGSLPGSSSTNYSAYKSSYQKYQQLLAQLNALGGYADGGISSGAQLAWVSEGTYSNEAHVPLPDGRTIPVTITNSGDTESVSLLAEIRAELEDMRQQQRAIGVEVIKANNTTAKILTEWKAIGMPTTQESN